jgi:outer membrane lipoprotein-sorting protein
MKTRKDLIQLVKKWRIAPRIEMHKRTLTAVLKAHAETQKTKMASEQQNIWRIIMRSPITKIATAAVILVSVVAGIYFLGVPTESVVWADVVRPILTARTVVFNLITVEGENVPTTRVMNMGTQRVRIEVLSADGKTVQVIVIDYDTFRMLQLIPSKKTAVVIDLKDLPEEPENILEELRNFVTEIQNDPEISVEQLGEKEIDGRVVTGFRARNPDGEFTVWADPQTALPIRIEQTWRQMQFVYTDFQFDIEMDESLFSMEIPEGYSELRGELPIGSSTEQDLVETLRMWAEVILDDAFPEDFSGQVYVDDVKKNREKFVKLQDEQKMKMAMKMGPGFIFVQLLKPENDWRYVGKNVKLGDAESPVCWYKPIGSQTYRVIYGDLSIRDILEEELPK